MLYPQVQQENLSKNADDSDDIKDDRYEGKKEDDEIHNDSHDNDEIIGNIMMMAIIHQSNQRPNSFD